MDTTHQCPSCPLRFTYRTELVGHLRDEHPHVQLDYLTTAGGHVAGRGLVPVPRSVAGVRARRS